jgi:hypothetical protein
MGILTRQVGEEYIITSDSVTGEAPRKRAPRRMTGAYRVWTGDVWSTDVSTAKAFGSMDLADEYVRANYARISGQG